MQFLVITFVGIVQKGPAADVSAGEKPRGRGRPPKDAAKGSKPAYVPTGQPRGRPPMDPALKKPVREPTGKPRGCPPGGWPEKPQKKPKGCPPGGWKNKDKVVNGGELNISRFQSLLLQYFMRRL